MCRTATLSRCPECTSVRSTGRRRLHGCGSRRGHRSNAIRDALTRTHARRHPCPNTLIANVQPGRSSGPQTRTEQPSERTCEHEAHQPDTPMERHGARDCGSGIHPSVHAIHVPTSDGTCGNKKASTCALKRKQFPEAAPDGHNGMRMCVQVRAHHNHRQMYHNILIKTLCHDHRARVCCFCGRVHGLCRRTWVTRVDKAVPARYLRPFDSGLPGLGVTARVLGLEAPVEVGRGVGPTARNATVSLTAGRRLAARGAGVQYAMEGDGAATDGVSHTRQWVCCAALARVALTSGARAARVCARPLWTPRTSSSSSR